MSRCWKGVDGVAGVAEFGVAGFVQLSFPVAASRAGRVEIVVAFRRMVLEIGEVVDAARWPIDCDCRISLSSPWHEMSRLFDLGLRSFHHFLVHTLVERSFEHYPPSQVPSFSSFGLGFSHLSCCIFPGNHNRHEPLALVCWGPFEELGEWPIEKELAVVLQSISAQAVLVCYHQVQCVQLGGYCLNCSRYCDSVVA